MFYEVYAIEEKMTMAKIPSVEKFRRKKNSVAR